MDDESDSESNSDSVYSHDPTPSSSTAPLTTLNFTRTHLRTFQHNTPHQRTIKINRTHQHIQQNF